jgi:hypothetical protein
MKKQIHSIIKIAAIAVLLTGGVSVAHSQQAVVSATSDGSSDSLIKVGGDVTFALYPTEWDSYQWLHNGIAIDGETNSTLRIEDAGVGNAGFYSCNTITGTDVVASTTASLFVYFLNPDSDIVVYGAPLFGSGSSGKCPGAYTGAVDYILAPPVWGWAPSTDTTNYTASDTTRTNTKVEYVGDYGDEGCNKTSVTIPYPAASGLYRFSIYFTNNVPLTNYPITLAGFNP